MGSATTASRATRRAATRRPVVLVAHPSPDLYGADRVVLETVTGFVRAGWRVAVTTPEDGPLTAAVQACGAETITCPTVVLRKSYLAGGGPARLAVAAARAWGPARRLLRRVDPDLVWVNTITLPLWSLAARGSRRRVVVHAHEAEDGVSPLLQRALALPLLLAHVVVVNSTATRRALVGALGRIGQRLDARTRRIYNGVRGPADAGSDGMAPSTGIPPRPARLLFVGRLSERKAPDLAVAALAALRARGVDVQLEVVGSVFPGYEPYEDTLHRAVTDGGLADRVRFTGFVPEVWPAYRRADIALVPSRVESLGNSAIEAMLAGVPLVATRVQGLTEVADGGRLARLTPPDDPGALADAVEDLLADWPATRAVAASARDDARQRFGQQRYYDEILAVAGDLLGRGVRTPASATHSSPTIARPR